MKKIKFELQIYCTVGWNDDEDTALLQVDTFTEALEIANVLKEWEKNRHRGGSNDKVKQAYQEIKESLEPKSGEEVMMVGEVMGIQCLYEDDKGVTAGMTLSDNSGVSGWAKVNSEEHENKYKEQLAEAKTLAKKIMKL